MLTRLQKEACRLHKLGFSYLPQQPVHWDSHYTKLKVASSPKPWISFAILMIFNSLLCIACAYDILGHYFIRKRDHFNIGIAAMLLLAGAGLGASILVTYIVNTYNECIAGVKEILVFHANLCTGKLP